LSRSLAYSLLKVTAEDALRYTMGEDVGYKQNTKTPCTEEITRELVKYGNKYLLLYLTSC